MGSYLEEDNPDRIEGYYTTILGIERYVIVILLQNVHIQTDFYVDWTLTYDEQTGILVDWTMEHNGQTTIVKLINTDAWTTIPVIEQNLDWIWWTIGGVLAVGLAIFFLFRVPKSIKSSTMVSAVKDMGTSSSTLASPVLAKNRIKRNSLK